MITIVWATVAATVSVVASTKAERVLDQVKYLSFCAGNTIGRRPVSFPQRIGVTPKSLFNAWGMGILDASKSPEGEMIRGDKLARIKRELKLSFSLIIKLSKYIETRIRVMERGRSSPRYSIRSYR